MPLLCLCDISSWLDEGMYFLARKAQTSYVLFRASCQGGHDVDLCYDRLHSFVLPLWHVPTDLAPQNNTQLLISQFLQLRGPSWVWLGSPLRVSQGHHRGVSWAVFSAGACGPLPAHSCCWQNSGWTVFLQVGSRTHSQFLEAILKFSLVASPFTRAAGEFPSPKVPLTLWISDF